jgi:Secretion system C-terminal sorting domain
MKKIDGIIQRFAIFIGLLFAFMAVGAQSAFQAFNTQGNNLIHITTADFDAVGSKDYVVAMSMSGKVIAFNRIADITDPSANNVLWEYTTGLFNTLIISEEANKNSIGEEILAAGTDGHLRILSANGQLLHDWAVSTGALYTVDVGTNKNGEILIATGDVDGNVYIYNESGLLLDTYIPKSTGVIKTIVAGNFDGLAGEEIGIFYKLKSFASNNFIDFYDLDSLKRAYYWNSSEPFEDDVVSALGWTDKQFPRARDMDGDGKDELVAHWGILHPSTSANAGTLFNALAWGELLKKDKYYDEVFEFTNTNSYYMQKGIPGNFKDGEDYPGTEMVMVYGDDLYLVSYDVSKSFPLFRVSDYTYSPPQYHFSDGACLEDRNGGLDKLVLSGPNNGDDNFYVVDLSADQWKSDAKLIPEYSQGVLNNVYNSLEEFSDKVKQFDGIAENIEPIHLFVLAANSPGWWEMTPENIASNADGVAQEMQGWKDRLGGDPKNVIFSARTTAFVIGNEAKPQITEEGIVAWCAALAQRSVYFNLVVGHGGNIFISPENLAQCLEASVVDGVNYMMVFTKEINVDEFDAYLPLLQVLKSKAAVMGIQPPKFMFSGKGPVYTGMKASVAAELFSTYKEMVVLGTEPSNVRMNEWSLAERVGLWMNGDVAGWGSNPIGDGLSANRLLEWSDMRNAHIILRYMLAHYSLGARYFRLSTIPIINPLFERGDINDPEYELANPYRQGVMTFLRIVEEGIYPSPLSPAQLKGISPVTIALPDPDERFQNVSVNHDWYKYAPQTSNYVVNNLECWHAYTNVPEYDMTSFLYNTKRRWDNLFPYCSGGFVPIVPFSSKSEVEANLWCDQAYATDANTWEEFGDLWEAKDQISQELTTQADKLIFHVEGECFWQLTSLADQPGICYALLMDNNVMSPSDKKVILKPGSNITGWTIYDRFNMKDPLGSSVNSPTGLEVDIPAGAVRILKIIFTANTLNIMPDETIGIWPNPASEQFYIQLKGLKGEVSLELFNLLGVRKYSKSINILHEDTFSVPIVDLSAGTYLLVARDEFGKQKNAKLMVN